MDEKLWKENGKESFFGGCLVEGRGGKKIGEAQVFSPRAYQNASFQNGEKTKWEEFNK